MPTKFILTCLLSCICTIYAHACSTPVFQYALERWAPDPFIMTVVHKQPLSAEQQSIIDAFQKQLDTFENAEPFYVDVVDGSKEIPKHIEALAKQHPDTTYPLVLLQFPPIDGMEKALRAETLNKSLVSNYFESPQRRELAKRLLNGHSVVWIVIKSGDKEKDQSALKVLNDTIKTYVPKIQAEINERLADSDLSEEGSGEALADGTLDLAIPQFKSSIIELDRTDKKERLLFDMLTRLEPELVNSKECIAIPVFGQGRALWPLMGEGINEDLVVESLAFLSGSCSCQIKDQNPGYDLMIGVDWDSLLQNRMVGQVEMPELIGPSTGMLPQTETPTESPIPENVSAPVPDNSAANDAETAMSPIIVFLGLFIAAILVGSIVIISKRNN